MKTGILTTPVRAALTLVIFLAVTVTGGEPLAPNTFSASHSQAEAPQPELRSAVRSVQVTIFLSLSSTPNTEFLIEFFFFSRCPGSDPQDIGAIPISLGQQKVVTDANGNTNFPITLISPSPSIQGGFISATATSSTGNTSELSSCIPITFQKTSGNTLEPGYSAAADSAINSATVSGTFFGAPDTFYSLNFFFTPATNTSCSTDAEQLLNDVPLSILTNGSGRREFNITLAAPQGAGFINCRATDAAGGISSSSSCLPIIGPTCPPSISPTGKNSGVGDTTACSSLNVRSNAEWIRVESAPSASSEVVSGSVQYSVEANTTGGLRIGTIDVNGQSFTISQEGTERVGPQITGREKVGKKLNVFGEGFDSNARIFINDQPQNTKYESSTKLIGKKAGKKIKAGDRIQIENSNGSRSNIMVY
jgi:hypothetical protein